jgi:hypothetical protein
MPSAGFEPTIPAMKQLQTYALDRTDTGIGAVTRTSVSYRRGAAVIPLVIWIITY